MRAIVGHLENIHQHPNAENMEIMDFVVKDHRIQIVTGKHYQNGERGFFMADGEIVPDELAEEMWLYKRLAGKKKNRVKAKEMKGIWSSGIFYGEHGRHWLDEWQEGTILDFDVVDNRLVVYWDLKSHTYPAYNGLSTSEKKGTGSVNFYGGSVGGNKTEEAILLDRIFGKTLNH